ncbi:hypothetical protein C8R44DRAFT_760208, partial [Mycena epipterygia]
MLSRTQAPRRYPCYGFSRVSFPSPRKRRPPPLEEDVDVDAAEEDAADGGRSTDRDFERDWRKRGSLDAGKPALARAGLWKWDSSRAVVDVDMGAGLAAAAEVDGPVTATAGVPCALCRDCCAR